MMLQVVEPGPFTTVQDDGRVGRAHQGIARSGAADQGSRALANRLVGNRLDAAVLEITFGPAVFRALEPAIIAVTGAMADITVIDSSGVAREVAQNCALALTSGVCVRIGAVRDGMRTYVAIRGGAGADVVLGSRSFDTLGRIGPPPLRSQDLLPIGSDATGPPWFEVVPVVPLSHPAVIAVHLGPRDDWLLPGQAARLLATTWIVSGNSDRTGVRIGGAVLLRRSGEIPTEAMIPGAVQLPMDGRPIILGPDCGTTGGYPVIAVVTRGGLDRVGQLRPDDALRFHVVNR